MLCLLAELLPHGPGYDETGLTVEEATQLARGAEEAVERTPDLPHLVQEAASSGEHSDGGGG
jgi:hypothetical protein